MINFLLPDRLMISNIFKNPKEIEVKKKYWVSHSQ